MVDILEKAKKVTVVGAARSGIAAAKLLKKKGYEVFLSDAGDESKIDSDILAEIRRNEIEHEFGVHSERVFDTDIVVVSPGVPQNSPVVQNALGKGLEVVSEIEAASWYCKGKVIAITGTNGKTTTTTLIGEMFKDAGYKTFVCGNIGIAFSDIVEETDERSIVVLETSSFQLDNIKKFKPFIAILLNVTPDHLDRYESFEKYLESKMRIAENQNESDYFVFNYDDELVRNSSKSVNSNRSAFSLSETVKSETKEGAYLNNLDLVYYYYMGEENVIDTQKLIIKGEHNVYNAMASVISAKIFGIEKEYIKKTLENFKGVEHRLEFVRELKGVKYYNDSKATNVNSVWYALKGFNEPLVLILGGKDKGNDYTQIEKEVKQHVKHIIAIGDSKQKVYDHFKDILPVTVAADMEDAVLKASQNAAENEVVLLSPACASFDMFDNYEHRGKVFKETVNALE
ncbi:MAG TPA: UDP-N-acetylmuramoyl-L-alanine--D-glutamate ligase [Ignavibacteria bacterium]|nr:UDP-N-acetylmuramoyl-L-alanine--D-glutamate ligase [Ignavibacteria bacterium]HRF64959.1 UDP-N-acetylmuramoyl-L-alanine--D-glutamate ligase [Ignavibacteria bacterium]HRJ03386.1 UDP-N-acetylmuramoyl-L-alanine--D-glutamate ligase [Ignavibacteria bacterium]